MPSKMLFPRNGIQNRAPPNSAIPKDSQTSLPNNPFRWGTPDMPSKVVCSLLYLDRAVWVARADDLVAWCWTLKAKLAWVGRGNPGGSHELQEEEGIGWGVS